MLPSRVIRDVRTLYFATVELGFQQRYLSAPQSLGISKDPRQTHEPRFSRPFAVSLGVAAGAITAGLGSFGIYAGKTRINLSVGNLSLKSNYLSLMPQMVKKIEYLIVSVVTKISVPFSSWENPT